MLITSQNKGAHWEYGVISGSQEPFALTILETGTLRLCRVGLGVGSKSYSIMLPLLSLAPQGILTCCLGSFTPIFFLVGSS